MLGFIFPDQRHKLGNIPDRVKVIVIRYVLEIVVATLKRGLDRLQRILRPPHSGIQAGLVIVGSWIVRELRRQRILPFQRLLVPSQKMQRILTAAALAKNGVFLHNCLEISVREFLLPLFQINLTTHQEYVRITIVHLYS